MCEIYSASAVIIIASLFIALQRRYFLFFLAEFYKRHGLHKMEKTFFGSPNKKPYKHRVFVFALNLLLKVSYKQTAANITC